MNALGKPRRWYPCRPSGCRPRPRQAATVAPDDDGQERRVAGVEPGGQMIVSTGLLAAVVGDDRPGSDLAQPVRHQGDVGLGQRRVVVVGDHHPLAAGDVVGVTASRSRRSRMVAKMCARPTRFDRPGRADPHERPQHGVVELELHPPLHPLGPREGAGRASARASACASPAWGTPSPGALQ